MKTITPTVAHLKMLATIRGQMWGIRFESVQEFALAALEVSEKSADFDWSDYYNLRPPLRIDDDGIAHIHIVGTTMSKAPGIYEKLGLVTRYGTIIGETESALRGGAKGILYHFDSPGGAVSGVSEAGVAITNAGIPTVAYCHGLACSCGYWLASGANAIFATPSATVGNIGTIITWANCDKMWADMGIEWKALVNEGADLKSTFHIEPNETQIDFLQESINEAGALFHAHVTAGRRAAGATLDEEVWRAGWYSGKRAGDLGLIDAIGTAEEAKSWLLSRV